MKTEENKRMLALSYIVADLMADNMELEQRVQQLAEEHADSLCKLNEKENRKGKDSSKQTLGEIQKMSEQLDHLIRKSGELERFAKAIHIFVEDKNLYMKKGTACWYKQVSPAVCSTACLECVSCLGVIEGLGVICEKRFADASVSFPAYE